MSAVIEAEYGFLTGTAYSRGKKLVGKDGHCVKR